MNTRIVFGIELAIGVTGFWMVMFLGEKGVATLAALAALTAYKQTIRKEFSSEKLLFYKSSTITLIAVMFFLLLLFFIQDCSVFTNTSLTIKDIWYYLAFYFLLFAHGLIGLILFKHKKNE
jgi:hypothetical protein